MKLKKENNRVEDNFNDIANNNIDENNRDNKNIRTIMLNKDFLQKKKQVMKI